MHNKVENVFKNSMNFQKLDIYKQEDLLKEFKLHVTETGWEDWMNNYTEAGEDEEISERESEEIEKIQAENFLKNKGL